jgi:hypothetical protein
VSFFTDGMPELFWSSGTRAGDGGELKLTEISLTPSPATVALPPVKFYDGLPEEARGLSGAGAPWGILTKATEVMRGVYDPMETRCWFDDRDAPPRRPVGESRGTVMRNGEPMEMFYRPATITAVY